MDWTEGKDFWNVTRGEEASPYSKLAENEKQHASFSYNPARSIGKQHRWKAAAWSPAHWTAEAAEGDGELSQSAKVKSIQSITYC